MQTTHSPQVQPLQTTGFDPETSGGSLCVSRRRIAALLPTPAVAAALGSLTALDLSRNALQCLHFLTLCTSLKTLSLYFNNVSELEELAHLPPGLEALDMRLNPVSRDPQFQA